MVRTSTTLSRATKVVNPTGLYEFGTLKLHRALGANALPAGQLSLGTKLEDYVKEKSYYGTPREKQIFGSIKRVYRKQLYIKIEFFNGTPYRHKVLVRNAIVKNGFTYADKTYMWTRDITASTKEIAIGPWSVAPRYVSKEKSARHIVQNITTTIPRK